MAEKSGGGAQPSHWKCNNPACGKELPGAGTLAGMRVCPECNADQRRKDEHRCVHCKIELTDAIHHSKMCGPETAPSGALQTDRDTASTPTDPKPQPPSPKPDKRPEAPSKDKSSTATPQTVAEPIRSPNGASTATPQAVILPKSTQSRDTATPPDIPKPASQPQNESSTATPQPVVAPPVTGSEFSPVDSDPKSTPDATHPDQNGDKPSTGSSTTQTHTPVQESTSNDSSGQVKAELVIGAKPQDDDAELTGTQQNTGAVPQLTLPPVFGTTKQEDADKDSVNKNGNPQQANHTMNDSKQDSKQDRYCQQQTSKRHTLALSDTSTHPLGSKDNGRGQGKGGGGGGGKSTATTNGAGPAGPGSKEMVVYKKTDKQENLFDPQTKKTVKGSGSNGQSGNKSSKPTTTAQQPYDYKKHVDPNHDLKGLRSAPEKSIAVTFHCIVPKLYWLWDSNSYMHMRFEGEALGNWKHNVGDFMEVRSMEEGVCEMVCTLVIDADLLKDPLAYKYVVFSPKMTKEDDCYEKLHAFKWNYWSDDPDRCLHIPPQVYNRVYGGEYQQYDMFVYPGVTKVPKSILGQIKRGLVNILLGSRTPSGGATDVEMKTLNRDDMARWCLHFYLDLYRFSEEQWTNFPMDGYVRQIGTLFLRHYKPCVIKRNYPNEEPINVIVKEMKGWLEAAVARLSDAPRSQHQFISAMAIACCVVECQIVQNLKMWDFVVPLLKMLSLQPDNIMERVSFLKDTTSPDFRPTVVSAIERLCKEAMNSSTREIIWDWLCVLPLYHFMRDDCEPFMTPEYNPEKISISAQARNLDLKSFRSKVKTGFVEQHYASLEPLFRADPLLLYNFIYLCPSGDYPSLYQRIPAYLSLACLCSPSLDLKHFYRDEEEKWLKWLKCIKLKINEESMEECLPAVTAALHLVTRLFGVLTKSYDHYVNVLIMSVSVVLFSLAKVKPLVAQRRLEEGEISEVFARCEQILKDWVVKSDVIGGSNFGGYRKGSEELELWQSILSLKTEDQEITERWTKVVAAVIQNRVNETPVMIMLNLVSLLKEESHQVLSSALMDGGMQAIDKISAEPHKYSRASDGLSAFVSVESEKVGYLFGRLLQKKYPEIESDKGVNLSLDDLLSWSHWPNFIRIYKGASILKAGLPPSCQSACFCAISKLEELSKQLHTGDITILDLQKIQKSLPEMKRLCDAAEEQKSRHMSYAQMSLDLPLRIKEYDFFEKQNGILHHLCQKLSPKIKGIREATVELGKDYRFCKINALCRRTDPNIEVVCFVKAAPLLSFAWKFDVMTKQIISTIFDATWHSVMHQALTSNPNLSISDVDGQVWRPAFQHCDKLLVELHSQSMNLFDVDRYFSMMSGPELELELKALLSGVNMCVRQASRPNVDWICQRVKQIMVYRKLNAYCFAANLFLELRDVLNLTEGDFSDVERISAEVSSSMKDHTLADINEELVETGKFLSEFTPDKMECIQQFCECQDIVHWIRKTTKDVSDLQNFVNVALATAAGGEDDFANDRLASLRTVGSGFSSLIYKLKKDTDFKELRARCTSVWTAYRNDRNLPEMLASCNKDLEWYKSVKETQGSVEVTSFGQMDNIQKYGCYTVTGKRDVTIHSIHDVIQLTLTPPAGTKLLKKSYSLDELRDLESKLVLITGSKAENRAAVEQFLDTLHCVCRIAEVLITLQQVGHVQFIGWRMDFYCQNNFSEDLQKQAKEMEDELERWNTEVAMARKKFYELNYYTTRQLLVLRSELGKMKNSGQTPQTAQVMALLESISCNITPDIMGSTVHRIATLSVENMEESDVQKSPIPQSRLVASSEVEPPLGSLSPPPINQPTPKEHPIKAVHMEPVPQVSLTREMLDEQQSEHFTNIVNMFGYNEMTALKAIEVVGNGDWNDIENWVEQNADNFEELFQDHEGGGERGEEEEKDENEEDEAMNSEADSQDEEPEGREMLGVVPSQSPRVSPSSTHSQTRVVVTHREAIDETHPEVQLLLDAEMGTPEQCIRAIEMYGTAHNAMLKMEEEEEEEEDTLFHGVTSVLIPHISAPMPNQQVIRPDKISVSLASVEDQYLKLNELGAILRQLGQDFPVAVKTKRKFPDQLKPGQPHLLVVPPEQVLRAALSLYMKDGSLPMPTPEEMLICDQHTTTEEVSLLWRRAVFDPQFKRIFCLVHAEKLSYQTADKALRSLADIIQNKPDYRLVIICSSQDEEKCPIISKLHLYRRQYGVSTDLAKYRAYLMSHFTTHQQSQDMGHLTASIVDHEGSCVRVVSSTRAGMGKTLFITRMSDKLEREIVNERDGTLITIPVHGPEVTTDYVMDCLVKHQDAAHCTILHFDISPSVLWKVDTILFSLLVQRGLCDRQGRVWRNHPSQLYTIEVTLPEPHESADKRAIPERFTMAVLEMLPSVNCVKPKTALSLMTRDLLDADEIVMDSDEFRSESFQRVYQYLRRHTTRTNLDRFSYSEDNVEGTPHDCLQVVLSYCGMKDPSWAEIKHFVSFLDLQLQSCERSCFCNEEFVGDVMAGLKSFVVKFMIRMSRDFSTSSLRGEVAQENEEGQQGDDLGQYQIVERKQWEQSSHPYIFFNQDRMSITFVGFMVTSNGDLIDPAHRGGVLEQGIMTHQLYTGLKAQRVNFDEDYRQWPKHEMIQKISTVMGIDWPYDPDQTYVLTVDNLIKILAIQMRFRCGIPVVIMGETGCGKTRLIRFMCDLIAQGTGKGNMLVLKVHGGTSEEDILKFVHKAEEKAKENRNRNLDTVVFFDEANTTEAIEMIKEIMCDGRVHGNPISRDLKFIAACNPYRRHTAEMIEKLRSAGLGFYVRESDTQQRLGKVPLRELVYRVIDLPPSMRPLVYDFGQLNTDTERDYTRQIVHDHIMKHATLSQQHQELIPAVARVLAWSQKYMRNRKDECSFVSLRDVERAMLVFTYFFDKMPLLRDAINEKQRANEPETEVIAVDTDDDDVQIVADPGPFVMPLTAQPPLLPVIPVAAQPRLMSVAAQPRLMPVVAQPRLMPVAAQPRLMPVVAQPRLMPVVAQPRLMPVVAQPRLMPVAAQPRLMPVAAQRSALIPVAATHSPAAVDLTRSLILAVSVCYHARLSDREDFEKRIAQKFNAPLVLSGGAQQFRNEIRWCQEVLLESMVLGENIARNAALRENVFMLAVCVDLRIPLFLVGKPGSSKSLAKAIVADSMRGQASQNELLKSFKQVHMFSYQCSQLSTPQSVIEVFNTAKRFQKNEDTSKYVSVVVLDEVGLAEDSPNLPLKALHPLLEDGTEGADENAAEVVEREKRVAFIGISNWALDPAKMNRGVMVTRGDPDTEELVVSAQGICHENDVVKDRLNHLFKVLAKAYKRICKRQTRQFFGLRDFYSLIKMLYWMCEKTKRPPAGPQLVHAIKRNFGGLKEDRLDPEEIFWNLLPIDVNKPPDLDTIPRDIHEFVNPDNTRRGLIKTSLKTKETSWHGENRYLLFLTENYAALEILKQYLQDREGEPLLPRDGLHHEEEETTLKPWEMEPFVLFGSSFPRDKEYTQVCRNINQIKICMEIGRTVILLNLENLYESLYDVLNQYYIHHGGNRYVDLGLQTHKVKCRVHDEFKLILIAEKTTVYEEFPTPLINRLEKHFVLYSSVLEKWQTDVLEELEEWIKAFSDVQSTNATFKEKDAFVGYQKDVAAAVVFQASSQLRKVRDRLRQTAGSSGRCQLWETAWQDRLLGEGSLEELAHEDEGSEIWREAVLVLSQYLLLQTTPPSALIRLHKSKLRGQREQFQQLYMTQHHGSIDDFLKHHLSHDNSRGGLLLQVTTHSHLLSSDEVDELGSLLEDEDLGDVHSFLLQEFDTELDFTSKVSPLFVGGEGSQKACLLIVQCDSGHINGNLIACARYRIYDMRAKALLNTSQFSHTTHVLFIVHLPVQATHSSFVGLQGDPWVSCHIDELRPSDPGAIRLEKAQGVPISELFYGGLERAKPDFERQTSDFAGSVEGMAFERMRSAEGEDQLMEEEEGERGEERKGVVEGDVEVSVIEDEEEEMESGSSSRETQEEPMEHDEQQNEDDDVIVMEGPVRRPPSPPSSDVIEMEGPSAAPPDHEQRETGPVSWKDKSFSEMYRQCVRLNGCIQAAASRLQDTDYNKQRAAERVRLLINLIPRKPVFPLDPDSFYGILVSHIHRMLCEREDVHGDDDWILNEAMDINHLQTGGTFTNVLTRQLDAVIVPCFSEIIAFLDRNCNLNLLQSMQPLTPLSQFWLNICASQRAQEALRFIDMVGTQKVPMKDEEFACEFPFSWLVIELLDSQWDNAQSTGGSSQRQIHRQLCGLVSVTPLGEILMSVQDDGQCEELYRRYIHDFVRSMHKCTHKTDDTVQLEYQLVQDSLHNMVVKGTDFASVDGHISLVHRIAAVHVVYRASSECLHWFGQLTAHRPGILAGVRQAVQQTAGQDEGGMMLHLYAVDKVLQELKPPIEAKRESMYSDDQTLRIWLNRLREISNSVESTLNLPGKHPITDTARLHWQKIRAIQMFTEHILLNHGNMITYAKRLNLILGTETDFLKCETVKKIRIALNNMHVKLKRELKDKGKDAKKQLFAIKKSCRNFFIEVVSGLCFGQSTAPDDDLVETLLNIVFTERGEEGEGEEGGQGEGGRMATRDLTPYKDDVKDEKPIIRSFLLQLLLEHDTEMVKGHLKTYFNRCQQALVGGVDVDQELCLLCIQCFEDAIDKEYSGLSLETKMEAVLRRQLLSSATETLTHFAGSTQQRSVSLEALDAVAKMRYALLVVAELLQLQVNQQGGALVGGHTHYLYGRTASILIEEARHACTNERINTIDATGGADTTGPIVYLLKLLVRGAGFSCLKKIVERQGGQLRWMVPQGLSRDEEEKTLDPFVIYDQVYTSIREEMSAAAYGRDYSHLEQHTAALQPQEIVPLLMSVYQVYTLSRASTQMSKQLLPETIEKMNDMIINCKTLLRELKIMARALVSNEQGGPLAALQVSAGQPGNVRTLIAVVVHTAATLLSRSKVDLLSPLVTLLTSPGDMAGSYLPTMAEDMLPEARRITGGRFYECPNGHPYFIGDCGRPVIQGTCNVCGSAIGGQNYERAAGNIDARTTDSTQTGHALGRPAARGDIPSPERSLSPAACCIVRAIIHTALLWCSCNNDVATEGLLALVKLGLRPQELPEFFWGHLERDIQLLARALGKNQEEAAIVVHLVVQNILTTDPGHGVVSMRTLGTRDVRAKWEEEFGRVYLHPILERLEARLRDAMGAILNDDKQEHDPLFYLVYERVAVVQGSLEPHLWGYRPRITLEHLTRYMQQQKKKFPILKKFLQNEAVLRATQYLPDIVRLQRRLFDTFHHRIDRKVARTKTVQEFIQSRHSENVLNEYREMVTSVQRAWNLVRDKLREHTAQFKLKIEDEWLQIEVNPDTPLDFFIPTTTGPGVCTFALTHYLAYIHNNFIDWCRAKCKNTWHEHKIRLPHIHTCHLLDYHTQLQSILLSHCRYSLRVGHGNEVSYDLPALEKHILDRFIHGKPRILVDIPQVSYQKDVYTAATFAAIRRKVSPQIALGTRVQMDILRELASPEKLRKSLDVVEIVLGFLTSGGGKPGTKLLSYLRKLKMEKKNFSEKAKEHCNLEHILSLWQTLSVGLARVITLSGQEPFHTLNHELLEPLSETQCQNLDRALPRFDLSSLLGTLYEFIETYIRHIDMAKKDWTLLDTLHAHLEANNLKVPAELDELPDDITLAQTVATWKFVVNFQAKQRQE